MLLEWLKLSVDWKCGVDLSLLLVHSRVLLLIHSFLESSPLTAISNDLMPILHIKIFAQYPMRRLQSPPGLHCHPWNSLCRHRASLAVTPVSLEVRAKHYNDSFDIFMILFTSCACIWPVFKKQHDSGSSLKFNVSLKRWVFNSHLIFYRSTIARAAS